MKLNLSVPKRIAESLMVDTCLITRDSQGQEDNYWDESSMTYVSLSDDADTIYSGACMISSQNTFPHETEEGGQDIVSTTFWLRIPMASAMVLPEDTVVVTAVDPFGDQRLLNQTFIIDEMEMSSYAVMRNIRMHRKTAVPEG